MDEQEYVKLDKILQEQGMIIKRITGDGNCLFRSFADQVEADQTQYDKYRQTTVLFMRQNVDFFAPFVADQEYDEYLDEMAQGINYIYLPCN